MLLDIGADGEPRCIRVLSVERFPQSKFSKAVCLQYESITADTDSLAIKNLASIATMWLHGEREISKEDFNELRNLQINERMANMVFPGIHALEHMTILKTLMSWFVENGEFPDSLPVRHMSTSECLSLSPWLIFMGDTNKSCEIPNVSFHVRLMICLCIIQSKMMDRVYCRDMETIMFNIELNRCTRIVGADVVEMLRNLILMTKTIYIKIEHLLEIESIIEPELFLSLNIKVFISYIVQHMSNPSCSLDTFITQIKAIIMNIINCKAGQFMVLHSSLVTFCTIRTRTRGHVVPSLPAICLYHPKYVRRINKFLGTQYLPIVVDLLESMIELDHLRSSVV